jgi:hypothetical protein
MFNFTTSNVVVTPPMLLQAVCFFEFGGNAGITNQDYVVVDGLIGTTAASTLVTGFTDGTSGDVGDTITKYL